VTGELHNGDRPTASRKPGPQQPIRRRQFQSLDGALQNGELKAEREDLELKRRAAQEGSENGGQESRQ
jgi:hypothetical protein